MVYNRHVGHAEVLHSSCSILLCSTQANAQDKMRLSVVLQEIETLEQDVSADGPLHKLATAAPGFSTAMNLIRTLAERCKAFRSSFTALAASPAAVPASEPSRQAQAASGSFSDELELVIESALLWTQERAQAGGEPGAIRGRSQPQVCACLQSPKRICLQDSPNACTIHRTACSEPPEVKIASQLNDCALL